MEGARAAAVALGYRAIVLPDPVLGEARVTAPEWLARVCRQLDGAPRKACVISSGETTVRVTGKGTGGRNLEFALSIAEAMASLPSAAMASIGTDGIDGSSGVAGGIVDSTTMRRAAAAGLQPPGTYLAANDSLAFFAPLGDTVRLGRTDTNVGDLQIFLIDD
jgi:glycerate-2-kinase